MLSGILTHIATTGLPSAIPDMYLIKFTSGLITWLTSLHLKSRGCDNFFSYNPISNMRLVYTSRVRLLLLTYEYDQGGHICI